MLIECEQLRDGLAGDAWRVLDCRFDLQDPDAGRQQYLQGHIPGALYVDLNRDLSGPRGAGTGRHPLPETKALHRLFARLGIRRAGRVVCYDAVSGGLAAARAWWLLRYMGHPAPLLLDGGWRRWRELGLPARAGTEAGVGAGDFRGEPGAMPLAEQATLGRAGRLVDVREPERYRGLREPIDPRAGHIPGARNLYWRDCLENDGRLRPPAALRSRLVQVLASMPAQHSVFYCGSGVTSCLWILAAVAAGMPAPALYPGSWSEWCATEGAVASDADE